MSSKKNMCKQNAPEETTQIKTSCKNKIGKEKKRCVATKNLRIPRKLESNNSSGKCYTLKNTKVQSDLKNVKTPEMQRIEATILARKSSSVSRANSKIKLETLSSDNDSIQSPVYKRSEVCVNGTSRPILSRSRGRSASSAVKNNDQHSLALNSPKKISKDTKLVQSVEKSIKDLTKKTIEGNKKKINYELKHNNLPGNISPLSRSTSQLNRSLLSKQEVHHAINTSKNVVNPTQLIKESPQPRNSAQERLRLLRKRLSDESQAAVEKKRPQLLEIVDLKPKSLLTPAPVSEEMEWEPLEDDRLLLAIQSVRSQLNFECDDMISRNRINNNAFSSMECDDEANERKVVYIVVDTNVFLSNLPIIERIRDTTFEHYAKPIIIVPWTTIRELDFIKDDKTNTRTENLKAKARRAIRFLNDHFSAKHPRVLGQAPNDIETIKSKSVIECPDDEILLTCLQIRNCGNTVVLLSYDQNLCNKAMIHDIMTLGRHDNFEKIDTVMGVDNENVFLISTNLDIHTNRSSLEPSRPVTEVLLIADDIYVELKEMLSALLTIIVAKEMENLFGNNWERYVIIKPPWTIIGVLKCAIKHWIAAVSDSFICKSESILKEIYDVVKKLENNCLLDDIENIIGLCFNLVRCLRPDKHQDIITKFFIAIDKIRKKYEDARKTLKENSPKKKTDVDDHIEESRAAVAFDYFKQIYDNACEFCGILAELMGIPSIFPFNKNNTQWKIEDIEFQRPQITANISHLMLTLGHTLENIHQLNINNDYIIELYNALRALYFSLSPEMDKKSSKNLSPLDIYFCLKHKEKSLKIGVGQFQELKTFLCQIANFRTT